MSAVLIIEDDEKSRRLLCDVLGYHGHTVLQTDSGESGLEMLTHIPNAIVLLDIQLPGISGFETLQRIRGTAAFHRVKIVAVTASVMDHDRKKIVGAGFDAYVPKPVDIQELLATIARISA